MRCFFELFAIFQFSISEGVEERRIHMGREGKGIKSEGEGEKTNSQRETKRWFPIWGAGGWV